MRPCRSSFLLILVLLASVVMTPATVAAPLAVTPSSTVVAQPLSSPTYCYNWDFFNNTGSPANDLHITLSGPSALVETFSNPPGQALTSPGANGTLSLNFTFFSLVAPGDAAHIGFCADAPIFNSVGMGGLPPFYWTFNGQPLAGGGISIMPMPGWTWLWQGDDRGHLQIGLANDNSTPISVRSVKVFQPGALQPLSNLNMAAVQGLTPLWQSNGPPVTVNPGIQSFFDVFLETFGSIPPPTERTPLIAVAVIDNPLARRHSIRSTSWRRRFLSCRRRRFTATTGISSTTRAWQSTTSTSLSGGQTSYLTSTWGRSTPLVDLARGQVNPATGLYTLSYSGVISQPGGSVHTGFCSDTPAVLMTVTWTLNGLPVGQTVPVPGWQWNWQAGGGGFPDRLNQLHDQSDDCRRRALGPNPQAIDLENLNWNDPLVQVLPFTTLPGMTFAWRQPDRSYPGSLAAGRDCCWRRQVAGSGGQIVQFMAQGPVASLQESRYCYNWDFTNWTGQPANDLHLALHGPTQLSDVYTGPLNPFGLPDASSGYDPAGDVYNLSWSGVTVASGGVVHVGFCTDLPLVDFPTMGGMPPHYWTWNGVPLNPIAHSGAGLRLVVDARRQPGIRPVIGRRPAGGDNRRNRDRDHRSRLTSTT